MILPDQAVFGRSGLDWPEAQRVHDGQRPRAHGENIAEDAADSGRRTLKRFDIGGVVVRLDLECACPAVADVNDAGIFARTLHNPIALRGQPLQMDARRFIGAVLAPHHAVNAQFSQAWSAAERSQDAGVLLGSDTVLSQKLGGNGGRLRGHGRFWIHGVETLLSHGEIVLRSAIG